MLYGQKGMLEASLEQEIEGKLEEQLKNKELGQDKERLEVAMENMGKLNRALKEQVERLQ